ncbi:MAG TPA: hypothetical protein VGE76_22935 [Opitutaceae bacterium]
MRKLLPALVIVCFALIAALAVKRFAAIHESAGIAPGTAQTTGCEEESFFAVWRAARGQEIYADTAKLPFASAYFNWLFYRSYGAAVKPVIARHGDASLPFAGRIVTLTGALVGAGVLAWLFAAIMRGQPLAVRALAVALALCVYFGTLPGWWAFTVRPDLWALALEGIAVTVFLTRYRTRPTLATLLATLLCYAAWSFKQNFVGALGATLLFLLAQRDWRRAALTSAVSVALWAATFYLLGPRYLEGIRSSTHADFFLQQGFDLAKHAALKLAPLLVAAPLVIAALRARRKETPAPSLASDALLLGSIGTVLCLVLAFTSSCKGGAASNYYFAPLLMSSLAVCAALATSRSLLLPTAIAAVLALTLAAPFTGRFGTLTLRPNALALAERWDVLQKAPEPRFAYDARLMVPWLAPQSPPIVLAFNYEWDRRHGRAFESGGIGGLLDQGFFASALLPAGAERWDGSDLARYARAQQVGDMVLHRRKDVPPAAAPR